MKISKIIFFILLFMFVMYQNSEVKANVSLISSPEKLAQLYIQYHDMKDIDKILSLFYLDGVNSSFIEDLKSGNAKLFSFKLIYKIDPLPQNYAVSFERDGKIYALSLPPTGMLEFDFNNGGLAEFTIPYANKDGKIYLVTRKEVK